MAMHDDARLDRLVEHHGHLGGFDVLGYKAGELLLERLEARKHFGLNIVVWCPPQPPHSCLLDGLQLSTGCTMGKRNLSLRPSEQIRVRAANMDTGQAIEIVPRRQALEQILRLTREAGPDEAGLWAWARSAEELWTSAG